MIEQLSAAADRAVSRETFQKLEAYVALLRDENERQNLVAASTLDRVWERHILDCAQLARFEPHAGASWVDIGSGAGLPGIVIACLVSGPVTLVEPRRLRADFLQRAAEMLDLQATVIPAKVDKMTGYFDVITARAVAPLARLIEISHHLSTRNTVWTLPKGRSAHSELADAGRAWQGAFHVEHSVTDDDSAIIVATGVRKR